jgi:hypothetical protein
MPAAVLVKESVSVQSPSLVYRAALLAEQIETLPLLEESAGDFYASLAASYRRTRGVTDTSGGVPGDRYPF